MSQAPRAVFILKQWFSCFNVSNYLCMDIHFNLKKLPEMVHIYMIIMHQVNEYSTYLYGCSGDVREYKNTIITWISKFELDLGYGHLAWGGSASYGYIHIKYTTGHVLSSNLFL